MDNAFKYIKANGGIDTEYSYPYKGRDGHCQFNPNNVAATVTGKRSATCFRVCERRSVAEKRAGYVQP